MFITNVNNQVNTKQQARLTIKPIQQTQQTPKQSKQSNLQSNAIKKTFKHTSKATFTKSNKHQNKPNKNHTAPIIKTIFNHICIQQYLPYYKSVKHKRHSITNKFHKYTNNQQFLNTKTNTIQLQ